MERLPFRERGVARMRMEHRGVAIARDQKTSLRGKVCDRACRCGSRCPLCQGLFRMYMIFTTSFCSALRVFATYDLAVTDQTGTSKYLLVPVLV